MIVFLSCFHIVSEHVLFTTYCFLSTINMILKNNRSGELWVRITKNSMLEGTSGDHLYQSPANSQALDSIFQRTVWPKNISKPRGFHRFAGLPVPVFNSSQDE